MQADEQHPQSGARRRFLLASALGLAGGVAGPSVLARASASSTAQLDTSRELRRIAFGSCVQQDQPQPIWEVINDFEPDLFVFLGDNIYGDTRDMNVLRAKYAQLAAQPGFRRLRSRTPVLATWDDHDYGENDAGAEYPMREQSRRIFCDFWGEPADSPRRVRAGIHTALTIGPAGRRVQLLLPDLRFNRTPVLRSDLGGKPYSDWSRELQQAGQHVPGPYTRNPSHEATMLGEPQWQWLEQQLHEPANLRILASSLQVLADIPGWEAWINYARDHQRLLQALRRSRAAGLVCISGDTHYAELSHLDLDVPYPLWDLTSSGLTEVWPVTPPNANRVGEVLREQNFGVVGITWDAGNTRIELQARDLTGKPRIEKTLRLGDLQQYPSL